MTQNPIIIETYSSEWVREFNRIREILTKTLMGDFLTIEHVGSTSIQGLSAKPILDITIVIDSRDLLPKIITKLKSIGYIHCGDKGIPGREAFERLSSDVPYTNPPHVWIHQHLYVCDKEAEQLKQHLLFRNYLRKHPDEALLYGQLKLHLAGKYRHNREAYTNAKTDFILEILRKATKEKTYGNI
ncbi:hypothetical protein NEF87_001092 [Candidatus Lokiarchaeum ossiferum]|uniref:GrpB family protein n=1 Tax=Candidatus Lokiarchaeum ossiferum TaxID=2951803 RepID=A0ABY6HMS4_9ARCH|nr:hypothetical protein NEF87_001092 [Candidatus Lokiarchaeum sp. B-35]